MILFILGTYGVTDLYKSSSILQRFLKTVRQHVYSVNFFLF